MVQGKSSMAEKRRGNRSEIESLGSCKGLLSCLSHLHRLDRLQKKNTEECGGGIPQLSKWHPDGAR